MVGGRRIRRLLVANRGEVAARIFLTCAALGIESVAVYAEPDADAPYVRAADLAVPLAGETVGETYLCIGALLAAASRAGADAVHPGYGFLAESADFAQAVLDAGLVWVGPRPDSMRTMASKVEAKRVAVAAGVPVAPSAELVQSGGAEPGREQTAVAAEVEGWRVAADAVGFPLLVKASAGGGGKGMRLVEHAADVVDAVRAARREAESSFGDPTVFLERYLTGARHVEVQVLGDEHGNVVHLFERECSIQRRHQKILEETPSPGLDEETRAEMFDAAVALARSVDYVGVGTVEFLVVGDGARAGGDAQQFFFLEMNTRLQVEHPVTEEFTGLDLVRLQLDVAEGRPHRWVDEDEFWATSDEEGGEGSEAMVLVDAGPVPGYGHAIEVRLYAEDPAAGYLPSPGRVHLFEPAAADVRWDAGVESGSVVTSDYDPLLAKVIASGDDRGVVAARLAAALRGTRIHGPRTNRDQLVAILESAPFLAGGTPTDFLDLFPELSDPRPPDEVFVAHLGAAVLAAVDARAGERSSHAFADPGWRNVRRADGFDRVRFDVLGRPVDVGYRTDGTDRMTLVLDGVTHRVRRRGALDLEVDGLRASYSVERYETAEGPLVCVDGAGWSTQLVERPRLPEPTADAAAAAGPTAPLPGRVVAVEVAVGDSVRAGDVLLVLEAMKMEHRVTAGVDGTVTHLTVAVGDAVDAHELLATIAPHPSPEHPSPEHPSPPLPQGTG